MEHHTHLSLGFLKRSHSEPIGNSFETEDERTRQESHGQSPAFAQKVMGKVLEIWSLRGRAGLLRRRAAVGAGAGVVLAGGRRGGRDAGGGVDVVQRADGAAAAAAQGGRAGRAGPRAAPAAQGLDPLLRRPGASACVRLFVCACVRCVYVLCVCVCCMG